VRISRANASVAERVIRERTEGFNLEESPFSELPAFREKLGAALKRRRQGSGQELRIWNLTRDEIESGYQYLMLFSHEGVPVDYLTMDEFEAVHDVALDLLGILLKRRGKPGLDRQEIQTRIDALTEPSAAETADAVDDRFVRRLKKQIAADDAFWASDPKRPPITARTLLLIAPPRNTRI
jgi:hypothetical protein